MYTVFGTSEIEKIPRSEFRISKHYSYQQTKGVQSPLSSIHSSGTVAQLKYSRGMHLRIPKSGLDKTPTSVQKLIMTSALATGLRNASAQSGLCRRGLQIPLFQSGPSLPFRPSTSTSFRLPFLSTIQDSGRPYLDLVVATELLHSFAPIHRRHFSVPRPSRLHFIGVTFKCT